LIRYGKIFAILTFIGPGLAACATQQAMTVDSGAIVNSSPKYRNALAVRSVTGGQLMNAMTVIGVANEPPRPLSRAVLPPTAIWRGPAPQNSMSMPKLSI
jgi:hypothetical protein